MTTHRPLRAARRLGAALLLAAAAAPAQFTSTHAYVTVAGNFNGYDTLTPNMRLISNHVWQGYYTLTNYATPKFLFATAYFTNAWKETNQPTTSLPIQGTAELNAGNDLQISTNFTGVLRMRFDDVSRTYSAFNVSSGRGSGTSPWINEIHYDNDSTDVDEGVEVAGPAGTSLSGYSIVLYNGNGGASYGTTTLSGTLPNQGGGFGTLFFAIAGMQNGDPDGIALVRNSTNLVQFISYGGVFTAVSGPADGRTSQDIGIKESSSAAVGTSLQLTGSGAYYEDFTWTGSVTATRGSPSVGQTMVFLPPAAAVTLSNLTCSPATPLATNTVHVQVNASVVNAASNLSATAFYATNGATRYTPVAMALVSGNLYRTSTPLPAQPAGQVVSYYVWFNFDGPGTNTPALLPADAPSNVASYAVSALPAGAVWINELNVSGDAFGTDANEMIELLGPAGSDLSLWTVQCYDEATNLYASYRLPNPTRLPNHTNGFGFFVLGDSGLPGADLLFTNLLSSSQLTPNGAVRLLDSVGATMDTVRYGSATSFSYFAGPYAGVDDDSDLFSDWGALIRFGTGGVASAFAWTNLVATNEFGSLYAPTPGRVNTNQVLTGGNTNALAPVIVCPSNILLGCLSLPMPTVNVASVTATGLCGAGSVTVTHAGDVTNTGTGCYGDPRIVTRTYRAVSECGTTSTCAQLIIFEDKTAPTLTWPTQVLVNAGFEAGDFTGWSTFGIVSNNVTVTVAQPRQGFFHARILAPVATILYDSSPQSLDGAYSNAPAFGQTPATTALATSVRFNVNTADYNKAEVPWDEVQNNTNFSFALWARMMRTTNTYRCPLVSRQSSPIRGFSVYASPTNTWEFWTGNSYSNAWHTLSAGSVVSGTWVHLAGSMYYTVQFTTNLVVSTNAGIVSTNVVVTGATNTTKRFFINGSQVGIATNMGYTPNQSAPLRIGAGASEVAGGDFYFPGQIDDVQLYPYTLEPTGVVALYNGGLGGVVATGAVGRYRMDEVFSTLARTSGFSQIIAAQSGQTWQASIHLLQPSLNPLQGSNTVQVDLRFLNSTGAVLAISTSPVFDAASPKDTYIRYSARAQAPSGTVSAALRVSYLQDSNYNRGTLYADDALLTPFSVSAGPSCAIVPDLRYLATATDSCSAVTITQDPAPGASIGGSNIVVRFIASDVCGLATTGSIEVSIVDTSAPTTVSCGPVGLVFGCLGDVPPPSTGVVVGADNCGSVVITLETNIISASGGCGTIPLTIVRRYRITDQSGNFTICNQTMQVKDTNAPAVVCVMPDLTNGSFETGTFANWNVFGSQRYITNLQPRSGSRHAVLYGPTNGAYNYVGMYQDVGAAPGQAWRAAGFVMQPAGRFLQGDNHVELKIEFLDGGENIIGTQLATYFTSNSYREVYVPVSVTATSPAATAKARCTVLLVQPNTPSNAPGTVFLDDLSLTRHMVSVDPVDCQGYLPDVRDLPIFIDCGAISTSQLPIAGSLLALGWNTNVVTGADACTQRSSCAVGIYVVDDIPPYITTYPTNIYVPVDSTNAIPYPSTNELVCGDNCGLVTVVHEGDTNNGATGLPGDPLIVTRTYRVLDSFSNSVLARQTITVEGPLPTPPTNVVVTSFTLGTNLLVRSVGTNSFALRAEYTTNLRAQTWTTLEPMLNYSFMGTNISSFVAPPTNLQPFIIRVQQYFP